MARSPKTTSKSTDESAVPARVDRVLMYRDKPPYPGAATIARVFPGEVKRWKAEGWLVKEL